MGAGLIVRSGEDLAIVSAKEFIDARIIDGGDTIVVNLVGADGRAVSLMIPCSAAAGMMRALGELTGDAEGAPYGPAEQAPRAGVDVD